MGLCISLHPHLKWRKSIRSVTSHLNRCCLPLQEYGNISYKLSSLHRRSRDSQERQPTLGAPQYAHRVSSPTESQILPLQPPSPATNALQRTQVACAIEAIFHLADPEEVKEEDLMSRQVLLEAASDLTGALTVDPVIPPDNGLPAATSSVMGFNSVVDTARASI
ncbi:hypothetical protein SprV_0401478000 [Sparganum proliferum]